MKKIKLPAEDNVLIMYSVSDTREPLSVLITLVDNLISRGNSITVVDTSALLRIKHGLPPVWISRLLGIVRTRESLSELLKVRNVSLVSLKPEDLPSRLQPMPEVTEFEVKEAVKSGYLSYTRDDRLRRGLRTAKHLARGFDLSNRSYWWLKDFLTDFPDFACVAVPNGRVADQRAFIHAALHSERKVLYYEIGRAKNKAIYAGWFRIHDRVGTQEEAIRATKNFDPDRAVNIAQEWITSRRKPNSDINQFSKTWRNSADYWTGKVPRRRATFFSSSADEFTALGSEWNLQDWDDQYDAFHSIAILLESQGIHCTLRVHPNLANKSPRHFWSEIGKIRDFARSHPDATVIWPKQPVDSYTLVEDSDYVVVARSTIGLEASALGKCVWTTTPTRYDLIADVRKIWKSEDVSIENFSLWSANPLGASRFIAHMLETDISFSQEMIMANAWNSSAPPWKVRLANLFIPQPLAHKAHVIKIELASEIQRRIPVSLLKPR